jgi:hypothetical protein
MGGTFLVLPVDHGCVPDTEALFLLAVLKGMGNGGNLKEGRREG